MRKDLSGYGVVEDPTYGFKRLDPIPDEAELERFYQSQYYDLIRAGGRASELRRLTAGGEEAESERAWLRSTLYADVAFILEQHSEGRQVLDVGAGTGELVSFLQENKFEAQGIEPSLQATQTAKAKGLQVEACTLEEYTQDSAAQGLDALILLNVLEHVPDPVGMIALAKEALGPGGIICVRVPNDFTRLQAAAEARLDEEAPWWIAVPDHINYFDFRSLTLLLNDFGFDVVHSQGDFPMEMFLLMGDSYIDNPTTGAKCHQKRTSFETAIPAELRRRMYEALAQAGIGRNCLVAGRLRT